MIQPLTFENLGLPPSQSIINICRFCSRSGISLLLSWRRFRFLSIERWYWSAYFGLWKVWLERAWLHLFLIELLLFLLLPVYSFGLGLSGSFMYLSCHLLGNWSTPFDALLDLDLWFHWLSSSGPFRRTTIEVDIGHWFSSYLWIVTQIALWHRWIP